MFKGEEEKGARRKINSLHGFILPLSFGFILFIRVHPCSSVAKTRIAGATLFLLTNRDLFVIITGKMRQASNPVHRMGRKK